MTAMSNAQGDADSEVTSVNLRESATYAVKESVATLLETDIYGDLDDVLPPSFAEDVMELAWRHQSDLDKTRFRRAIRDYIKAIASTADVQGE
jgi:hypothetical protein